jgi:hypothetical protein
MNMTSLQVLNNSGKFPPRSPPCPIPLPTGIVDICGCIGSATSDKDALNTLIQSYNVARESWLTYRDAIATNTPTDLYFEKLAKNLTDLTTAIRNLQNVKEVKP